MFVPRDVIDLPVIGVLIRIVGIGGAVAGAGFAVWFIRDLIKGKVK